MNTNEPTSTDTHAQLFFAPSLRLCIGASQVDTLLDSSMPTWLTAMQDDIGWRRTLIELAKEHKVSALLRFVLKQLSDMGYHSEIAAIISETDLFSVFNGETCCNGFSCFQGREM